MLTNPNTRQTLAATVVTPNFDTTTKQRWTFNLHTDQQNTTHAITQVNNSSVILSQTFDPFGNTLKSDLNLGSLSNPLIKTKADLLNFGVPIPGWQGSTQEKGNQANFGRRSYDPTTGTFSTQDPVANGVGYNPMGNQGIVGSNHQNLGRTGEEYSINNQNPITNTEQDGYLPIPTEYLLNTAFYLGNQLFQAGLETIGEAQSRRPSIAPVQGIPLPNRSDYTTYQPAVYQTRTFVPSWRDYAGSSDKLRNDNLEREIAFSSICKTDTTYPYGCNSYHSQIAQNFNLSVSPNVQGLKQYQRTNSYSYQVKVSNATTTFNRDYYNLAVALARPGTLGTPGDPEVELLPAFLSNLTRRVRGEVSQMVDGYNNIKKVNAMREPQVDVGPGCGRTFSTRVNCEMYDDESDLANQSLICRDQYRGDHICTSKDLDILSCQEEFNCEFYHKLGKETLDFGKGLVQGTVQGAKDVATISACGSGYAYRNPIECIKAAENLKDTAVGIVQTGANCATNITKSGLLGYDADVQDGFECLSTAMVLEGGRGVLKGRGKASPKPRDLGPGDTLIYTVGNPNYVPPKVYNVLEQIKQRNGTTPVGYKGNRPYTNDGRGGGQVLPKTDSNGNPVTYKEYDVDPSSNLSKRNTERIIKGTDGKIYYTNDHYLNFIEIE